MLEVAAGSARGGPQPAREHPGSPPRSTQQQGLESLENGGARGWSGTCRTAYFSKVYSLCTIVPGRPKTVWAPNQAFTPMAMGIGFSHHTNPCLRFRWDAWTFGSWTLAIRAVS
ncbi:hypothetical protein IG631_21121 [Alternaria alternata]|nr:hypothetical protein IG631_21121 [Alternaria alternata]